MLTARGHGLVAYFLIFLAIIHGIDGQRLDTAKQAATATEPEPD